MALGLFVGLWAVGSVVVGWWSRRRCQDFWFGLRWSLILSPILGAALVGLSGPRAAG
ncbi:MAG: hypothetical protein AAGC57_04110 [Pseudomonadota bacterium]